MQKSCSDHSSYEVRTDEDIKHTAVLASEIWYEDMENLLDYEQITCMLKKFQSFDAIKEQIEKDSYRYKILKYRGENAGYFSFCKAREAEHLFLFKLYIKKNFRGKGIGRCIFEEAKNIAQELKLDTIHLRVYKHNANAVKTYEKWGFRTIDNWIRDFSNNLIMNDYIMEFKHKN